MREDVGLVSFLKKVELCKSNVYLETNEGDKLNLSSRLSRYVLVVLADKKEILSNCEIVCEGKDAANLADFIVL